LGGEGEEGDGLERGGGENARSSVVLASGVHSCDARGYGGMYLWVLSSPVLLHLEEDYSDASPFSQFPFSPPLPLPRCPHVDVLCSPAREDTEIAFWTRRVEVEVLITFRRRCTSIRSFVVLYFV
jgi:hypothetical protein